MDLYIVITIVLIVAIAFFGAVVWLVFNKQRGDNVVVDDLVTLVKSTTELVGHNQARFEKMRPFIASYFNTLYKDGSNASEVKIINQITYILERRIEKANLAIKRGTLHEQKVALEEFNSPISVNLTNEFRTRTEESDYESATEEEQKEYTVNFDELEGAMENLLQSIGQRIANASENMSSYRGERKRKGTLTTLTEVGIKSVRRDSDEQQ